MALNKAWARSGSKAASPARSAAPRAQQAQAPARPPSSDDEYRSMVESVAGTINRRAEARTIGYDVEPDRRSPEQVRADERAQRAEEGDRTQKAWARAWAPHIPTYELSVEEFERLSPQEQLMAEFNGQLVEAAAADRRQGGTHNTAALLDRVGVQHDAETLEGFQNLQPAMRRSDIGTIVSRQDDASAARYDLERDRSSREHRVQQLANDLSGYFDRTGLRPGQKEQQQPSAGTGLDAVLSVQQTRQTDPFALLTTLVNDPELQGAWTFEDLESTLQQEGLSLDDFLRYADSALPVNAPARASLGLSK